MSYLPSAVILSTSIQNPLKIVKGILDDDLLSEPELGPIIGVDCWPWEIDNKYYMAPVHLAVVGQPESNLSYILDHGEALLVYCDSLELDVLSSVDSLVDSLGNFEPDVQMLICDSCDSSSGLSRYEAQKWCIDRGWELIELSPCDHEPDEDDDFPESWGFKRIQQALHAHAWSNLSMKGGSGNGLCMMSSVNSQSAYPEVMGYHSLSEDLILSPEVNGYEDEATIDPSFVQADMLGGLVDPTTLEDCLTLASGCGNFEDLFSRFEQMKQTAAGLPSDQRKDYAEKLAMAFWNAMGVDDDEDRECDSDKSNKY